jgi:predicted DCC family thiol-disulfide oxidoreductase YuxK
VRFVLAEDWEGRAFRFAPLQGETFEAAVPAGMRADLPDSFVLRSAEGRLFLRSEAVARLLLGLGGLWRLLGHALLLVPRPLRDGGYAVVARLRKRLFSKPAGLCPMLPPHLGQRFGP